MSLVPSIGRETADAQLPLADRAETTVIGESFLLLPEPPAVLNDPLAELEGLLLELKQEDRRTARRQSELEEQHIAELGAREVKAMRERAEEIMSEGYWTGLSQIGGGALTVTGGVVGLSHESLERGKLFAGAFSGSGEMAKGVGSLGAAGARSDQTELEADVAALTTTKSVAERRAQQAQEALAAARDDLRALLTRIEGIRNAEIAAEQAAIFRV